MDYAFADICYKILKILVSYGFFVLSVVDSALIVIASKKGIKENIALFPGWINFHYKYGIWKINVIKILLSVIFPYPELALSPRIGILFFYLCHVIVFSVKLFLRAHPEHRNQTGSA